MMRKVRSLCAAGMMAWLLAVGFLAPPRAWGLINKRYTPADLVKGSKDVVLLTVSAPKDGMITAKVEELIKGQKLPAEALIIDANDVPDATAHLLKDTYAESDALPALMLTSRIAAGAGAKNPAAMVLIGTHWFALYADTGKYRLDTDPRDLDAVWAGGARSLARAARALGEIPRLDFPVAASMRWAGDVKLGHIGGKVNGVLTVDFRGKLGRCVVVLADDGDRVFQRAAAGGQPTDITAASKLVTRSKLAVAGDFSGEGRLDMALWDGKSLLLARQAQDGAFVVELIPVGFTDCASLACIEVGNAKRAGLLAGTSAGPILIVPDDKSGWTTQALKVDAGIVRALGAGGICLVADFHHHGFPDIIQLFSKGYLVFSADKPGHYGPASKREIALVDTPVAALAGDFDSDGELDLIVSGADGSVLLSGESPESLGDHTVESAELAYHGNLNSPSVVSSAMFDVNNDGRPGFELFYARLGPMGFFNRGFACFGLGREIALQDSTLSSAPSLQEGTQAGTVIDLSGDGIPDLLAVDGHGDIWLLVGEAGKDRGTITLDVTLPIGAAGPVTFSVTGDKRLAATHVLRAGETIQIGSRAPADLTLQWTDASGQKHSQIVAMKDSQRIELTNP